MREKYTLKTSNIYVPARIPHEKAEEIRHMAGLIYRAFKMQGFCKGRYVPDLLKGRFTLTK